MSDTDASAELSTTAIGAALEGVGAGADCASAIGVAFVSPSMSASRAANRTVLDIMKTTCAKDSGRGRPSLT